MIDGSRRVPRAARCCARPRWCARCCGRGRRCSCSTDSLGAYRNLQLANGAYYFCVLAGLTVLAGSSGQISLGHGAFMAVGAYTVAKLSGAGWALIARRPRGGRRRDARRRDPCGHGGEPPARAVPRRRHAGLCGRPAGAGRQVPRPSSVARTGWRSTRRSRRPRSARPSRSSAGRRGSRAPARSSSCSSSTTCTHSGDREIDARGPRRRDRRVAGGAARRPPADAGVRVERGGRRARRRPAGGGERARRPGRSRSSCR